jgi:isopentenyl diphosphate isomerase/L-lactate dehydrogenase-like FMN-dependent dehydrogenase
MADMLRRAREHGYRTLCFTVDLPIQGRRERDIRNDFTLPMRPTVRTAVDVLRRPAWLWALIAKLRKGWNDPFVVKGVLHPDDARAAVRAGADAVIVSNHGGREPDTAPGACTALPGVVAAIQGEAEILLDSGVRRSSDILKALALGARACMIGRPFLWGLASAGEAGVARTIAILREELDIAMALLGTTSLPAISAEVLVGQDAPVLDWSRHGACSSHAVQSAWRRG